VLWVRISEDARAEEHVDAVSLTNWLLLLQLLLLLTVLVALPLEGADPIVKGNNVENDGALNPYGRPELLLPLLSDSEARE